MLRLEHLEYYEEDFIIKDAFELPFLQALQEEYGRYTKHNEYSVTMEQKFFNGEEECSEEEFLKAMEKEWLADFNKPRENGIVQLRARSIVIKPITEPHNESRWVEISSLNLDILNQIMHAKLNKEL